MHVLDSNMPHSDWLPQHVVAIAPIKPCTLSGSAYPLAKLPRCVLRSTCAGNALVLRPVKESPNELVQKGNARIREHPSGMHRHLLEPSSHSNKLTRATMEYKRSRCGASERTNT